MTVKLHTHRRFLLTNVHKHADQQESQASLKGGPSPRTGKGATVYKQTPPAAQPAKKGADPN